MTSPSLLGPYPRVLRHFAVTRAVEVCALQASPLIGGILGGFIPDEGSIPRLCLLLIGSLALTAHVFVFNDWAGRSSDIHDPRRTSLVFAQHGISSGQVVRLAIALLIASNIAFAVLGTSAILLGAAIAALSLLYSCSTGFGKSTPIAASINHLVGGTLHFLLGYTLFHGIDLKGVVIGLFFGLVFAGGHLNQEVRDYEGDRLNGIRTSAVVFGCRRTFIASLCLFSAAYGLLIGLSASGMLPRLLLWSPVLWCVHLLWSLRALRRGPAFETALWIQHRYRLLFALTGLAMMIR